MKKPIIISLIALCLIFTFMESAIAQETLTHGCYNWRSGTLRVVANPDQCNPRFENYIPWHQAIPPGGFTLNLYVNGASGQDLPGGGLTQTDAFQTITYALQQLMYLRPTQEIETLIHVAPAIYNENLIITGNNLQIVKDESYSGDVIIDGGGNDVITINSSKNISINGISIQNGIYGIRAISGSSVKISNTIVQNCYYRGIQIDNNSTAQVHNCSVIGSGNIGIAVYTNSSVTFTGNIAINNNGADGIRIGYSSAGILYNASINTDSNNRHGFWIEFSSSLLFIDSDLISQDNMQDGMMIWASSSLFFVGSNTVLSEGNGSRGLVVGGNSYMHVNVESVLTMKNNSFKGFQISNSSGTEHYGTIRVEGSNHHMGMHVFLSSTFFMADFKAQLIVKEVGGDGPGILIDDNSNFVNWAGKLIVENNGGDGIIAERSSNLNLSQVINNPNLSTIVQNNQKNGIVIRRQSIGSFKPGAVVTGNTNNGIFVSDNSTINVLGMLLQNNGQWGIISDDGSSTKFSDSVINGNTSGDIKLEFGSRGTFNGNTIGSTPITCDNTALSRGDTLCP